MGLTVSICYCAPSSRLSVATSNRGQGAFCRQPSLKHEVAILVVGKLKRPVHLTWLFIIFVRIRKHGVLLLHQWSSARYDQRKRVVDGCLPVHPGPPSCIGYPASSIFRECACVLQMKAHILGSLSSLQLRAYGNACERLHRKSSISFPKPPSATQLRQVMTYRRVSILLLPSATLSLAHPSRDRRSSHIWARTFRRCRSIRGCPR
jgi:hypothetical protein